MAVNVCLSIATIIVYLLVSQGVIEKIDGAGECGKTPIPSAAVSLTSCLSSSKDGKAKVPPMCCNKIGALINTAPKCLCAVLLSPLAKQAGINPGIAITIPKRCNIKSRPVGKKCGRYTVP